MPAVHEHPVEHRRRGQASRGHCARDGKLPVNLLLTHPGEEEFQHALVTPGEHLRIEASVDQLPGLALGSNGGRQAHFGFDAVTHVLAASLYRFAK
jgi:hypothetical protein